MSMCMTPYTGSGEDDDGHGHDVLFRCKGQTQFPEPAPGISGFQGTILPPNKVNAPDDDGVPPPNHDWKWSVADKVAVPRDLKPGNYLLSWRWDSEESTQVWQNCADVTLV